MNHSQTDIEHVKEYGEDTAVVNGTFFNSTQAVNNEDPYLPKEVWICFILLFTATLMWACCRSCLENFALKFRNAGAKACSCIICWHKPYAVEVPIGSPFGDVSNANSEVPSHYRNMLRRRSQKRNQRRIRTFMYTALQ